VDGGTADDGCSRCSGGAGSPGLCAICRGVCAQYPDRAPIGDIDIATSLTPDLVTAALKAAGIKAVPTGIEHGTVTAVANGIPFEVTTLRRDVSTDGRRAIVDFTWDWTQDAQRRDFTLNAVYADRDGVLHDPTGRGVADARAGAIVFVGDARTRIAEDSLRILRFYRFLAWYGRGQPDREALEACRDLGGTIANLPAERTSHELLKLLAADDPRSALGLMAQAGVLEILLPQVQDLSVFNTLVDLQIRLADPADPVLRLAAVLPRDRLVVRQIAETLRLAKTERDRLIAVARPDPDIHPDLTPNQVRQPLYRLGVQGFCDQVRLAWASSTQVEAKATWRPQIDAAANWVRPKFPITGDDAAAAGISRGPSWARPWPRSRLGGLIAILLMHDRRFSTNSAGSRRR